MKSILCALGLIVFQFASIVAQAEFLQGTLGNFQNRISAPQYEAHVFISYVRMNRWKAKNCNFDYSAVVSGSERYALYPLSKSGSITIADPIGGNPGAFELECWSAMVSVTDPTGRATRTLINLNSGLASSDDFYRLRHPEDQSSGSEESRSLESLKQFLNSRLNLVLIPEIDLNFKRTVSTPTTPVHYFDYWTIAQSGSLKKIISDDLGSYILPTTPFQDVSGSYAQWVLLPPTAKTLTVTAEAAVFTRKSDRTVDKKCIVSHSQVLTLATPVSKMKFDFDLDCTPVP